MTAPIDFRSLSPARQTALMDAAHRRAIDARREAMRAFWSSLGRALQRGSQSLRTTLAASVARPHTVR
ncbi:hypothetical protein [Variovorax sp. YR752]|uniref:hypothetical protein n=1 Tax=Variovorax sp. YR752 TaxID=1884383 RepID=UPI0031382F76